MIQTGHDIAWPALAAGILRFMQPGAVRVLVVGDALSATGEMEAVTVDSVSEGLSRLAQEGDFSVTVLALPERHGLDLVERFRTQAPNIPLIVVTDDTRLAEQAMGAGADDYLPRAAEPELVARALRYSLERHRLLSEVQAGSLVDATTGLCARAAFDVISRQQVRIADRMKLPLALVLVQARARDDAGDDHVSPSDGRRAILDTAKLLANTFRQADLVGRIGDDLFGVLLIGGTTLGCEVATGRLQSRVEAYNASGRRSFTLSLRLGAAAYNLNRAITYEELVGVATEVMERRRRARVLVADSDADFVESVETLLGEDHDLTVVGTGQEAVEWASEQHPHLVLIGFTLPDMPGLQVVRRLALKRPTSLVPVLVIGDSGDASHEVECLRAGVAGYVHRDVEPAVLRAHVDNILERWER